MLLPSALRAAALMTSDVRQSMRRTICLTLLVLLMLLLVFGAGAWTAMHSHWGTPIATITVSSDAGIEIESVVVTYTSCGFTRKISYKPSEQHARDVIPKEISMPLVLCGEGSHITEVVLRDGKQFTTTGSYVEGGHEFSEHVTQSGIHSKHRRNLP